MAEHIALFNKLKILMLEYNVQKYCMDGVVPENYIINATPLIEEIDTHDLYDEFLDFLTFNEWDKFSVFIDDFYNFYGKSRLLALNDNVDDNDDGGGRGDNMESTDFGDDLQTPILNPDIELNSQSNNEQRPNIEGMYTAATSTPMNFNIPSLAGRVDNMESTNFSDDLRPPILNPDIGLNSESNNEQRSNIPAISSEINTAEQQQQITTSYPSNELSESQKRLRRLLDIVNMRNQQNNTSRPPPRPLPRPLPRNTTPRLGTANIQGRNRRTRRIIMPPSPPVIIVPKRPGELYIRNIKYKQIVLEEEVSSDNHESVFLFNNTEYLEILKGTEINFRVSSDLRPQISYISNLNSSHHISRSISDLIENININIDVTDNIDYDDAVPTEVNTIPLLTENATTEQEEPNNTLQTIPTKRFYGRKLSSIQELSERHQLNSLPRYSSSAPNLPVRQPFESLYANYNPNLPSTSEAAINNLNYDHFDDINMENVNENIINNNRNQNGYLDILRQRNPYINYAITGGGVPRRRKRKREEQNVNNVINPDNMTITENMINPENINVINPDNMTITENMINPENINADTILTRKKNIQDFKKVQEQFVKANGQNYQNVMKFDFDCYTRSFDPDEFTSFLNVFKLLIQSRGNPVDRNLLLPELISERETICRRKAIKTLTDIEIAEILNNYDDNEANQEIEFSAIQLKRNPNLNPF